MGGGAVTDLGGFIAATILRELVGVVFPQLAWHGGCLDWRKDCN